MNGLDGFALNLEAFFREVWQASWQGAVAIGLVLLARRAFGARVPARWHYLLWFLVLARLLVPTGALPHTRSSLENLWAVARPSGRPVAATVVPTMPRMEAGMNMPAPPASTPALSAPKPITMPVAARMDRFRSWWIWAARVWLGGVGLLGGWLVVCHFNLRRRLRQDTRPVEAMVSNLLQVCCRRWLRRRAPRLLAADWVSSPALVGWWRPTLLVPRDASSLFSEEDWEHVFAHEIAHLRWRDHWSQVFMLAAWCVHWFNPVVWLGWRRLRADRELAADEWVLKHLAGERALAYGETLFKTVANRPARLAFQPGMVGISEDGAQLKQRLQRIAAFLPQRRVVGSLVGLGIVLLLASVVLGQSASAPAASPAAKAAAKPDANAAAAPQKPLREREDFSEGLLAAARAGDTGKIHELLEAASTPQSPAKFSAEAAATLLDGLVQRGELTAFTTLDGVLSRTNYARGWQPSDEAVSTLVKEGRTDFLDVLIARRLDLQRLSGMVGKGNQATGEWITRRVAEVTRQRAGVEALGTAASQGDLPTLQRLVNEGVDVNGVGQDDNTPLLRAVFKNQLEAAQFLLDHGAQVDKPRLPGWNYTPLCLVNSVPMAELLKQHGADVHAKLFERDVSILTYVVDWANADVVAWFLQQGLDANMIGDNQENLLFGLKDGATAEVLLEAGADPNHVDEFGRTPLAAAQSAEVVQALVRHGANLKPKLKGGITLLEYAVTSIRRADETPREQAGYIEELIKQGAEFDPKGNGVRAMIAAAFHDQVGMVQAFLDHGVSPDAWYYRGSDQFQSALSAAAMQAPKSLKLLLERGADPNAPVPAGQRTPLDTALGWGAFGNVDLLRQAGAKGLSDLAYYTAKGDVAKVSALLDHHADPNEAGSSGWTPMIYAVKLAQVEVARRLLDHGASVDQFDGFGFSPYLEFILFQDMIERDSSQAQVQWRLSPPEAKARLAAFQQLFAQHPPNFAYRDSAGRTALHQAAWAGNSMIEGLMLAGHPPRFDPDLPDKEGRTPLLLAALSPAARDTRETIFSDYGTPQQKSWNQQAEMAKELLEAGARLDLVAPGGKTVGELALAAARDANNPQLISVLSGAISPHPEHGGNEAPAPASSSVPTAPALPYKLTVTPEIKKAFAYGEGIEIRAITGTALHFQVGKTYRVVGVCRQQTLNHAMLYVGNTAEPGSEAIAPVAGSSLYTALPKGSTPFDCTFKLLRPGVLHATIYDLDNPDKDDNTNAGINLGDVVFEH